MDKTKSYTIPKWLDKILFDDFNAVYEPCPTEVVYNPDQPYDFVKLYLGTYFPRSYAEAYGITTRLLTLKSYVNHLIELEEVNILDFCCGTGGEIIGTIVALQDHLPNLKRINVDAFDANVDAIYFLYHLISSVNAVDEIRVDININPQCIYIETEQEIQDIVNLTNVQYHFMMSFKAINEFVQHHTFESNPYELVASYLFPLLSPYGVFIMCDVTTKLTNSTLFYPQIMNSGLNNFLKKTSRYKTIIPASCYTYEGKCFGCYMQDTFYVTHRKKYYDVSKVAYRVICNQELADEILPNNSSKACRATNQTADKSLPYNSN